MLPEESVALHLFEPRYRELFADHKCGKEFVILYQNKGTNSTCGTLVTIEQIVDEFPDGTVDIIVKGVQVVKILSFEPVMKDKIYSGVEVEKLRLFASADRRLTTHFKNYMSSIEKSSNKPEPYSLHYIADRLQLSNETKNEFICIASERAASAFLINEIRFLTNIREQEASLKHNFYLN